MGWRLVRESQGQTTSRHSPSADPMTRIATVAQRNARGWRRVFAYKPLLPVAPRTVKYEGECRPSLPSWGPAYAGMTTVGDDNRHFRTNRSSRLGPAHHGMKMGALVGGTTIQWLGRRVGCRSAGSGGQAPALHFPSPPLLDSGLGRNHHGLAKAA